ncbi:ATP-binding protein [Kitasatospora misakiensis]|uniref:ATP-binding protein n=1 Tax=Kitasatospora misakiensis TaxID=67330 RepID=A0ABW0X3K2_9ACTN
MTTSWAAVEGAGLPPGGRRRRLRLAGLARPVAHARTLAATALADWYGLAADPRGGPGIAGDVVLLVAELVSNAMLHGDGPVEFVLDATEDRLRIELSDRTDTVPTLRRPHHPALPGGHGLHIVHRTADRWGAEPLDGGKVVWAEVTAHRLHPGG